MKYFSLILFVLLMATFASAIVVDDYSVATSAPTNELSGDWNLNWDYVYNHPDGSCVAVGEYWILTAAHVADYGGSGTLNIGGVNYFQQEIIYHAAADDPDNADDADLALVRYDKPFPGFYPLYSGDFPRARPRRDDRLSAVMVGYGVTGTVASAYYTPAPYNDSSDGVKRWGSQKIDRTSTRSSTIDSLAATSSGFEMDFDLGETTYEAGVASYDSGGGSFVKDDAVWKLAGINTLYSSDPNGAVLTFAVSMPAYETWIAQTMANATSDDDADGIPNDWEYEKSGSTVGVDDAADEDTDGLTGLQEYQNATDPFDPDSDDDWMPDGWEVDNGLSPTNAVDGGLDFDSDTLVNSNEYLLATDFANPDMDGDAVLDGWEFFGTSNTVYGNQSTIITNADSDADGLSDGVEMGLTNSNGFISNPNVADSDSDGIPDAWEVVNGINPLDGSDDDQDQDDDGFVNFEEWIADTNPTKGTSFLKIDSFADISRIVFVSSTNRRYQIEYRTDLSDSNDVWQAEPGLEWFDAVLTQTVKAVSSSASNRFYRLQVRLP